MTPPKRTWSITDFLTDGSLAALTHALAELSGCDITLHTVDGRRIIPAEGTPPWRIVKPDTAAPPLAPLLQAHDTDDPFDDGNGRTVVPLRVGGQAAGAFIVHPTAQVSSVARQAVVEATHRAAQTASEFCDENVENRRRTSELSLLLRLSSLLVAAHELDEIVGIALRTAIEVTGADAGLLHVQTDDADDTLRLRAHLGLSERFIESFDVLSTDSIIDRTALSTNEPLITPRLAQVDGVTLSEWIEEEGLVGMISVGLTFRGQPLGLLRLYTRAEAALGERTRVLLRSIGEQTSAALAGVHLVKEQRRQRQMQRHLALAADIQRRMLPRKPPNVPGIDIAARYISSRELSGDFYDLLELHGHLGIVVGDVVGKGIPAALLMAAVRASLRAHATEVYHLDEVIRRVNTALSHDTHAHEFATLFYGVLDPDSLILTYCNAGHEPSLIVRPSAGEADAAITTLDAGGMVLGIDPTQDYERATFQMRRGDLFFACTDGVTEAMNFEDEKFGRTRLHDSLCTLIRQHPDATAEMAVRHVLWDIRRFTGLRPETDDLTIVAIRA
jgi:sigma-B regulation protein RsbU (phosphoserine phosphatase)